MIRLAVITCTLLIAASSELYYFVSQNSASGPLIEGQIISSDVVVAGAGPSGIAASIAAARLGKHVALVEQTDWLGGQMSAAGVSNMDEGYLLKHDAGVYGEFISEMNKFYKGKATNTCYWTGASRCFEPSAVRAVLTEMLQREPLITVYFGTSITHVSKHGLQVAFVDGRRSDGLNFTFQTKMLIDASETGYVLPLAGSPFRIGNGVSNGSSTPDTCIQNITVPMVVRKYFFGVPSKLRMKTGNPPGGVDSYNKARESFSIFVSDPGNSWFINEKTQIPYSWDFSTGYRGIPDSNRAASNYSASGLDKSASSSSTHYTQQISKTIINQSNDVAVNTFFLTNIAVQTKLICQAKLRSLQYLYYIQVDLHQSNWSIANDEGFEKANQGSSLCPELSGFHDFEQYLPIIPYVRESRRIIGDYTLTASDIGPSIGLVSAKSFPSSIAVGDYPADLHGCSAPNNLEMDFENSSDMWSSPHKFEIPLAALVTKNVDGLIAAEKNISVSRVVEGAIREQPISMQTGLAAGVIAATALDTGRPTSSVNYAIVQQRILQLGGRIYVDGE